MFTDSLISSLRFPLVPHVLSGPKGCRLPCSHRLISTRNELNVIPAIQWRGKSVLASAGNQSGKFKGKTKDIDFEPDATQFNKSLKNIADHLQLVLGNDVSEDVHNMFPVASQHQHSSHTKRKKDPTDTSGGMRHHPPSHRSRPISLEKGPCNSPRPKRHA